ncbi:hypothetical protein BAG01nite_49420 [Brevibacillus agri]|uniref:Uncharacterized protein n=1 Tax=Brevibacillus agri TaxID=51101 RepID=A0ABQ0T066_9BACL|nr:MULTISPECIES: hypothetical protein [Brevibacillus]EJL45332.1 hypothetical protein PMI08_01795 [Brevibacillus sp. CF112]MDR9507699.1 hypothetical protein [Brevibacillus agri]MED3501893.1 hypothetical protein [Brevibacillus agri]GED28840.1 hypothetical protein BAG01nite_49420 [Brevibacillus agri]
MKKRFAVCAFATMLATMSIFTPAFAESNSKQSDQQSQERVGVKVSSDPTTISQLAAAAGVTAGPFILRQGGGWPGYYNHNISMGEAGTISVRLVQQGIHTGEQASTRWTLENSSGTVLATTDVKGDKNPYTITFTNVKLGDYNLVWETLNSYDTQGNYYIYAPSGTEVSK